MDSRKTTQGNGDEQGAENVVRLPRDWLGPREELVPIGSRARTAEPPDQDPAELIPPGAASFWSEDSGSLQAPMQAPADAWRGRWEPAPAASPDPPAPARRHRRLPRLRLPNLLGGGFAHHRRRVPVTALGIAAAGVVVLLAVIGQTEGGTQNASNKTAPPAKNATMATGTGANRARLRATTPIVTQIKPQPTSHHAARTASHRSPAGANRHRARAPTGRHHDHTRAQSTHQMSEPVRRTVPTSTQTPATEPTTSAPPANTTPPSASTARSTSSSSSHQPAFGSNGSLGPGSSPDS